MKKAPEVNDRVRVKSEFDDAYIDGIVRAPIMSSQFLWYTITGTYGGICRFDGDWKFAKTSQLECVPQSGYPGYRGEEAKA